MTTGRGEGERPSRKGAKARAGGDLSRGSQRAQRSGIVGQARRLPMGDGESKGRLRAWRTLVADSAVLDTAVAIVLPVHL